LRVERVDVSGEGERSHPLQHWKEPRERSDVGRDERVDELSGHLSELLRERVDQAVERLERNGLLLVALPDEHGGLWHLRANAIAEAFGQSALSCARAAAEQHDLDRASHGALERR